MKVQLKESLGGFLYPRNNAQDDANNALLSTSEGSPLYPSTELTTGNCELKVNGITAYPINNSGGGTDWRPVDFSLTEAYSGTFYQGVAIFDNYAIYFTDNSSFYIIINVITGERVASKANFQPADLNRHTNTLNFGPIKYDEQDTYYLLYGSGNLNSKNTETQLRTTCDVYRVQYTTEWNVEKVQTINFGNIIDYADIAFWGNYIVFKWGANVKICNMPPIKDQQGNVISEYTMQASDIVSTLSLSSTHQSAQGFIIVGDYLINLDMSSDSYNYVSIFDMNTGNKKGEFLMRDKGLTRECEQISYHESDNQFYIFTRGAGAYKIDFTPPMPIVENNEII